MTVGTLKRLLEGLPNAMPVVVDRPAGGIQGPQTVGLIMYRSVDAPDWGFEETPAGKTTALIISAYGDPAFMSFRECPTTR